MVPVDDKQLDLEEAKIKQGVSRWMREYWRPLMAMQYLIVCMFDFVIAPITWTAFQAYNHQTLLTQWNPTTLGSGGTYHLAMGAVLGVAAWTRSIDKENEMMRGAYMNGVRGTGSFRRTIQMPLDDDEPMPRKPLPGME